MVHCHKLSDQRQQQLHPLRRVQGRKTAPDSILRDMGVGFFKQLFEGHRAQEAAHLQLR
jgi:hypothetical protein